MKVIKAGTIQEKWWIGRTVICKGCNAELQFDATDSPAQTFDAKTLSSNLVYSRCPLCGTKVELAYAPK